MRNYEVRLGDYLVDEIMGVRLLWSSFGTFYIGLLGFVIHFAQCLKITKRPGGFRPTVPMHVKRIRLL